MQVHGDRIPSEQELASVQQRLEGQLERLNQVGQALEQQRVVLILRAVSTRLLQYDPDIRFFDIIPTGVGPRQWELGDVAYELRDDIFDPDPNIAKGIASVLHHLPAPRSEDQINVSGMEPIHTAHGSGWNVDIPVMWRSSAQLSPSIIDTRILTEDDFSLAFNAAQDRLEMVATVRTRGDFADHFTYGLDLREGIPDTVMQLAIEDAFERYREAVESPGGTAEADSELFFTITDEVANFFHLHDDSTDSPTPTAEARGTQPHRRDL